MPARFGLLLAATVLLSLPGAGRAETATFAVASNFAQTAETLAADYARTTGDQITITSGATGKLYAQVTAGAPFDALLSADRKTPEKLVTEGAAVAQSQFTYAIGQLVLWSADPNADLSDPKAALRAARHVAIANPDLAPYGKAAVETLAALGFSADLEGRIVTGENIGQAQAMTASRAADLGFVAASSLAGKTAGASWPVPAELHQPLAQDAVLLARGKDNRAAKGFLDFLKTPEAKAVIAAAGYGVGP